MASNLYNDVYGAHCNCTAEQMLLLSKAMAALPDGIFNTMFYYYMQSKSSEDIAAIEGVHPVVAKRHLLAGISLLQLWVGVSR